VTALLVVLGAIVAHAGIVALAHALGRRLGGRG
jgi:hypothetical protein